MEMTLRTEVELLGRANLTRTAVSGGVLMVPIAIWSGNVVVTKMASEAISPGEISFYRWLIALLVLLPFLGRSVWRERRTVARYTLQIITLAVLGLVVYQGLAYEAARTTSALNMGIILASTPLMSLFMVLVLAGERPTGLGALGGVMSLSGLAYLVSKGDPIAVLRGGLHIGDALMLAAVLANATYGVLLQKWTIPLGVWQLLLCQIGVSVLVLLPVWLSGPIRGIEPMTIGLVFYAAVPASILAPACWIVSIHNLGTARTSLALNLLPVVVAAAAWLFLGEQLRPYHAIGGGLALIGVAIGLQRPARPRIDDQRQSYTRAEAA